MEVGCGTGVLSVELARLVRHMTAVDTSKDRIAKVDEKTVRLPGAPGTGRGGSVCSV